MRSATICSRCKSVMFSITLRNTYKHDFSSDQLSWNCIINCMPLSLKQDTCNFTYFLFISVLASLIIRHDHAWGMTLVQYSSKFQWSGDQMIHSLIKIDGGFIIEGRENGPKYCWTSVHDDIFGLTCGASKQLSFPIMKCIEKVRYCQHWVWRGNKLSNCDGNLAIVKLRYY